MDNGFGNEFYKFVNNNFNYGVQNTLDDDIKEYIRLNVFPRYIIKEIELYENIFGNNINGLNFVEGRFTDIEKLRNGYKRSKNFNYTMMLNSNLNFNLRYNIIKSNNYSIAISVNLIKK